MLRSSQATRCSWRFVLLVLVAGLWLGAIRPARAQFGGGGFGSGAGLPGVQKQQSLPRYRTPVLEPTGPRVPVKSVEIRGHRAVPESQIRAQLETRPGRALDPEVVQADVRRLTATGRFHNVRTYQQSTPEGVVVTFEVFELPTIQYVRFVGNHQVKQKALLKKCELAAGQPMHRYRVEEARRRLEEFYHERGNADAQVEIFEGNKPEDQGVVFYITEGPRQRVLWTFFEGNTITTDARLRTQIESKPGPLWFFKGRVDRDKIDADVERLTAYYRSLGYFQARVGRKLDFNASGNWLKLTFVIDEGPRYTIRNVSIVGNQKFSTPELVSALQVQKGDYFDARKLNRDVTALLDRYGSQGYIYADVKADPRFLEQPGQLDLVYNISEGEQYRVGRVIVNIEGDNPHTRRSVVMNRLSLAPGDIIDIRKIRDSERRIKSSQLFLVDPAQGVVPSIAIRPQESDAAWAAAPQDERPSIRGQDSSGSGPRTIR